MNISNRQRQILELLLNRKDEITAGEIAAEIKVSTRTVHRELSELEEILAAYDVSLHKKNPASASKFKLNRNSWRSSNGVSPTWVQWNSRRRNEKH